MNRKRIIGYSILILVFIVMIAGYLIYGRRSISDLGEQNTESSQTYGDITTANSTSNFTDGAAPRTAAFAKAKAAATSAIVKAAAAKSKKANANSSSASNHSNALARKVILSGSMEIESNRFDESVKDITNRCQSAGGFIEASNITGVKAQNGNYLENREASFTLRIPSSKFESFMINIGNLGVVTSKTSSGEDITSQYYDSAARLNSLKVKEARLLDILKKAKNLVDILAIETELENTRYNIESITGSLKLWDSQVEFSTLNITLREVYVKKVLVKKPITLTDKIKNSFNDSIKLLGDILKGSIIFLVAALPFIIILGIIAIIIWKFLKVLRKNNKL